MQELMVWLAPVMVAVITGLFSYLGVSKSVKASHDQMLTDIKSEYNTFALTTQHQISSIKEDISRLETKQDKHNAVIERTYKLEQRVEDLDRRISDH